MKIYRDRQILVVVLVALLHSIDDIPVLVVGLLC